MAEKSSSYLEREYFLKSLRYLNSVKDAKGDKKNRFCFILGSGASRSSGILTGTEMGQQWLRFLLEKESKDANFVRSLCACSDVKWEEWAAIRRKPDFSRDYFPLYELRYAMDPDEGEAYLTDCIGNKQPSRGYLLLSELLNNTRHDVLITTNFDHLTEKAFEVNGFNDPMVLGTPNSAYNLKHPTIAKVHGDHVLTPLNCRKELEKLNPYWETILNAIIPHYIPIVIGYSAGDHTLMSYLEQCKWLERKQVYWCSMDEKENDTIERFLGAGRLRRLVPMNREGSPEEIGFDGIMAEIYDALMPGEGTKPAETPTPKPSKPTPVAPSTAPVKTPAPEPEKPLPVLSRDRLRGLENKDTIETLVFRDTLAGAPDGSRDLSEAGDESVLCWRVGNTLTIAGEGGVAAPESCKELFEDWRALRTVTGAELLDTSGVTDMSWMFHDCGSLQTLEVGSWNTGNVMTMWGMFRGCGSLQTLEVGSWNTGNVMNMEAMFRGCGSLERLEVGSWNTANVTDMSGLFWGCSKLETLEVGSWNTGNVTDMIAMFRGCGSLQTLEVGSWNTENVTNMTLMFDGCGSLQTPDVGNWNTRKVTDTRWMFNGTRWAFNPPIRRIAPQIEPPKSFWERLLGL